ncbi:MAG: hypothetical protein AAF799_48450 [Myxococcota bacterium]
MPQEQEVEILAKIEGNNVVFDSGHEQLRRNSDGTWTFTILEGTPAQVVFRLVPTDDGGCQRVVQSAVRVDDNTWGSWIPWPSDKHRSPPFEHGKDFRFDVALCDGTQDPPRGGGFFQVRDEGGGGD